ncbi:SDR family NAD(P)-dependent oxidoreductase, partial [Microbacterium marinilacus]
MTTSYEGKKILVTGGTGSFGHTVAAKLLQRDVAEIRILSRDEAKQDLMRQELPDRRLRFYVGDVRDYESVERATRDVDYVFHAAALKQVPSCEFFPMEAVRTNVNGSENVVRASEYNGVKSLVCLSTDKAVYPVNAMGMSKALMEKVAQSHGLNNPHAATTVSCVRY